MAKKNVLHYNILLISLLAFLFLVTEGAPQRALVTQLPGFNGTFNSKHYSGYLNIDESHGKNLYYYFVESERNPSKDPVVLWLNGGPGCSSFDGFVYEHGPLILILESQVVACLLFITIHTVGLRFPI